MSAFIVAWGLLTSIKLPFTSDTVQVEAGKAFGWFPMVGLILGGLLVAADWALGQVLPFLPAAVLVLAIWVGFTGLLHLDGFIDCCDALLPPRTPERRLEILHDVHTGAFGVVGVVLLLLLKVSLIADLAIPLRWAILLTAPVLGRWSMVWLAVYYQPARQEGMAHLFRQGLGYSQLIWATLTVFLITLLSLKGLGLGIFFIAWLATILLAYWILRRIPGLTGDCYGAVCELIEVVVLLVGALIQYG